MAPKTDYVKLTQAAFDKLMTYSTSLPTATTIGKQWKAERPSGWWLGEYVPDPDPGMVGIRWRKIWISDLGLPPEEVVGNKEAMELWCKEREREQSAS